MSTKPNTPVRSAASEEKSVYLKCPGDLRYAFKAACASNDQNSSQVIRDFMRKYVAQHGQGRLL